MNKYADAACKAEKYVKEQVRQGRPYVTYGELNKHLGIDRMTGWHVLGALVERNTEAKSPLWSSFVSYCDDRYGVKGWPGSCFNSCAEHYGWTVGHGRDFARQQRQACRDTLNQT